MSISDLIVVMKEGVIQQTGKPQDVYDSPDNLFVAKFLGTPPINVFDGHIRGERLFIGEDDVAAVPGVRDQAVHAAIRPEGFVLDEAGPLVCALKNVEVMGRDISVVSTHPAMQSPVVRSIIGSDKRFSVSGATVRFRIQPDKLFIFDKETEARIPFGSR